MKSVVQWRRLNFIQTVTADHCLQQLGHEGQPRGVQTFVSLHVVVAGAGLLTVDLHHGLAIGVEAVVFEREELIESVVKEAVDSFEPLFVAVRLQLVSLI